RGADEGGDIRRDPALDESVEVLAERRPRDVELDVALALGLVDSHLLGDRSHRALAEHFEGDALPDVALRAAVSDERRLRVAQHVDEARSDGEVRRIDILAPSGAT